MFFNPNKKRRTGMSEEKQNAHINLSGDHVRKTINTLLEEKKVSSRQGELIWWLFAHIKGQDISISEAARRIGIDGGTISKTLHGKYTASYDGICDKIENFKMLMEERRNSPKNIFVMTEVAEIVHDVCHSATVTNSIAFIFGNSHIGKTIALEKYAEQNKSKSVHYVRLPASAGVQLTAQEIASACYISPKGCFSHLRERILKGLNENSTLIIDELHQALISYQKSSAIKVFEFLREIHDRTKCGMILCGTHVLRTEIEAGKLAPMLDQLRQRGIIWANLPSKVCQADIAELAKAYGLEAPKRGEMEYTLSHDIVTKNSIGRYVKFLDAAGKRAAKLHQPISWKHFIDAHGIINKYGLRNGQ
jgi:DNA transposition AAA+ family ATPase